MQSEAMTSNVKSNRLNRPEVELTENDMAVLRFLLDNEYTLPTKVITMKTLGEKFFIEEDGEQIRLSVQSLYKIINKLVEKECIKLGTKLRNASRYYISPKGAEMYASYRKVSFEDKAILVSSYYKAIQPPSDSSWAEMYDEIHKTYEEPEEE